MKVHIKIFPIVGICDQSQKLELPLEEGNLSEALALLEGRLGVNLGINSGGIHSACKIETLMFLHNGRRLDSRKDAVFRDGDQLWLLPLLSGG